MVAGDAWVKATVALIALTFALILLLGRDRLHGRAASAYLATFFILIAGNQAAEVARALAETGEAQLLMFRVATVFAALDPVALHAFGSHYAASNERRRDLPWYAVLAFGSALALQAATLHPFGDASRPPSNDVRTFLLTLFTFTVYASTLIRVVHVCSRRSALGPPPAIIPALMVAALPVASRTGGEAYTMVLLSLGIRDTFHPEYMIPIAICRLLVLGLVVLWIHRVWQRAGRSGHPPGLGAVLLIMLFIELPVLHAVVFTIVGPTGVETYAEVLGKVGASMRWLVFGIFVFRDLVRGELLDLSSGARNVVARILFSLFALGMLVPIFLEIGGRPDEGLRQADVIILVLVVLLSQTAREMMGSLSLRIFGLAPLSRRSAVAAPNGASPSMTAGGAGIAATHVDDDDEPFIQPGRRLVGRYDVLRFLARGASGRVFLARDILLDRYAVLKEVPTSDRPDVERVLREARIAGSLQHPRIVSLNDLLMRQHACVFVTEYVAAGSLADRVAARGPLSARDGAVVVEDVLEGLAQLHARRLVHRDVKPHNVLLDDAGRAKLADFGVARSSEDAATQESGVVGTPGYLSPEQQRGLPASTRSDVYAVGLIIQRCVNVDDVDMLRRLATKATSPDPADRYADAAEMLAALRAGLHPPGRTESSGQT